MSMETGAVSLQSHKRPAGFCGNDTVITNDAVIASEAKQSPEATTYHEVMEIAASLRSSRRRCLGNDPVIASEASS